MDAELTFPQLVTAILTIVTVFMAVLQLKEHPRTRALLFFILSGVVLALAWYVSPSVTAGNFRLDRAGSAAQVKTADDKVARDAQEFVKTQELIDQTKKEEELAEEQGKLVKMQREKDLEVQEELKQKAQIDELRKAAEERRQLDAKVEVEGVWKCSWINVQWNFHPDGTITTPTFPAKYEVLDSTHVKITDFFGSLTIYDLSLNGPEETLSGPVVTCRKPKG